MRPSTTTEKANLRPLSRASSISSHPRNVRLTALAPFLLLVLLLHRCFPAAVAFAPHAISNLPGRPPGAPAFGQWSGYISVGPAGRKKLFYWLTESVAAPRTKPLVLWLNGGPGCSSIGYGLLQGLGPWRVASGAGRQLQFNPLAWNKLANVLFLDSPAGTGFSYSLSPADLTTGDNQTAFDTVQFLRGFLRLHPRYNGRTLLLTGESYAGHYIPQLADLLVSLAARPALRVPLRLTGVLLGNPFVLAATDISARTQFLYDHGLLSTQLYTQAAKCHFSPATVLPGASCYNVMKAAELADIGIDPYDIYAPLCLSPSYGFLMLNTHRLRLSRLFSQPLPRPSSPHSTSPSHTSSSTLSLLPAPQARGGSGEAAGQGASGGGGGAEGRVDGTGGTRPAERTGYGVEGKGLVEAGSEGAGGGLVGTGARIVSGGEERGAVTQAGDPYIGSSACMELWVKRYLQQGSVQRAIHVIPSRPGARVLPWQACSSALEYSQGDMTASMLPVLQRLIRARIRLWVMSGDTDSVVPFTGTRQWVASLRLPLLSPLQPWTIPSTGQVGGWVTRYKGLTFTTVRGAGHGIPASRPVSAFTIFDCFLRGVDLTTY